MIKHILVISSILLCQFASAQTVDASGKKQGYWKKKDEKTNKLIYEGLFKDDKPQGVFKYYGANDSVKAIMNFKQDGKFAYSTMFHLTTGKKMAEGKYVGEAKDSVWVYYDEKGILISRETFDKGKKHGKVFVYFPDGIVSEEHNYKLDVQDGVFKQYYDKTRIKGEGKYEAGQLEGKNSYYFPNGVAAATGYYKKGQKVGPWIYKNKEGKVTEKELYKNGKLADKKETDEFFSKNKTPDDKKPATTTDKKPTGTKAKNK